MTGAVAVVRARARCSGDVLWKPPARRALKSMLPASTTEAPVPGAQPMMQVLPQEIAP